jgi:omega-6 fatty acid desaturase (delta-12 desaturase)
MLDSTRSTHSGSNGLKAPTAASPEPTTKQEAEVSLRLLIAPFAKAQDARAWAQFATTLSLFVLGWAAAAISVVQGWGVFPTLLLMIPTAGFTVRLFIFQHDCGHGSFFSSDKANHAVGAFIGMLTMVPYSYWKKTHAIHHATSGNLDRRGFGDIDTMTLREYQTLPLWRRLAYRVYRHPAVLLGLGPSIGPQRRFPSACLHLKEWNSVLLSNLA